MTRFAFPAGYDAYGFATGHLDAAVPRGRDPLAADPAALSPYLATFATMEFARRDDAEHYLVDRISRTTTYEVVGGAALAVPELRRAVLAGSSTVDLRIIGRTRTYYDGARFVGRPLGVHGEHGLPVRAENLAVTEDFLATVYRPPYLTPGPVIWTDEYPQEFRNLLPALAGYVHDDGGFYVTAVRHRYGARGLTVASLDPLGAQSVTDYDAHDLLPVRATAAAGLVTTAEHDYRVLRPRTVTDINGNTSEVRYSPAGLVTARFLRGKDGTGDRDLPSTQLTYDLGAFLERGEPVLVRTVRRVHDGGGPGAVAA